VPVAVNLYEVREAQDAGGELFRSVQRQKDQYQGIWIVSPEGEVLAGIHDYQDFENGANELLETIDAGLAAFGPVERRDVPATAPLPFRGTGIEPDGNVSLALYVRHVLGGGRGGMPAHIEPSRAWLWDGEYRMDGPAVIDTLTLTAEELRALTPAKTEPHTRWKVPEPLARKFVRVLSATSDQAWMPLPEEAEVAELEAEVKSVKDGLAHIWLAGRWETVHAVEGNREKLHYGAAEATGVAVVDLARETMLSLLLVFDGTIRVGSPESPVVRTGAVVEWRLDR
jgi:hypothetical protein